MIVLIVVVIIVIVIVIVLTTQCRCVHIAVLFVVTVDLLLYELLAIGKSASKKTHNNNSDLEEHRQQGFC